MTEPKPWTKPSLILHLEVVDLKLYFVTLDGADHEVLVRRDSFIGSFN